jgi:hypothetical protein
MVLPRRVRVAQKMEEKAFGYCRILIAIGNRFVFCEKVCLIPLSQMGKSLVGIELLETVDVWTEMWRSGCAVAPHLFVP